MSFAPYESAVVTWWAPFTTTDGGDQKTPGGDIYVALGDTIREEPGVWRLRIAHHPLIDWVFGGAALIAVGGFMSLAARLSRRSPAPATSAETPASDGAGEKAPAGAIA